MTTIAEINEARERVDVEIHRLTTEINTRIAERNRLNAERLRLSDLATQCLADELKRLRLEDMMLKRIHTKSELKALAKDLEARPDWHEPDEQGLTVFGFGSNFDNAGHWGLEFLSRRELDARTRLYDAGGNTGEWTMDDVDRFVEMFVVIYKNGHAVAEINLATLFAFACDTYSG